jgi:hypothetical protein
MRKKSPNCHEFRISDVSVLSNYVYVMSFLHQQFSRTYYMGSKFKVHHLNDKDII